MQLQMFVVQRNMDGWAGTFLLEPGRNTLAVASGTTHSTAFSPRNRALAAELLTYIGYAMGDSIRQVPGLAKLLPEHLDRFSPERLVGAMRLAELRLGDAVRETHGSVGLSGVCLEGGRLTSICMGSHVGIMALRHGQVLWERSRSADPTRSASFGEMSWATEVAHHEAQPGDLVLLSLFGREFAAPFAKHARLDDALAEALRAIPLSGLLGVVARVV